MPQTTATARTAQQDNAPRLLYDGNGASRQLSITPRSLDYFLAAGKFKTRRVGRKVLIPHTELVKFAASDHWQPVKPGRGSHPLAD